MERPGGWVVRVALNEIRRQHRRRVLERRALRRSSEPGHVDPPAEPDDALWRAVAALPARSREAVALRYVADLPEDDVAAAMGVTRGTVARTLSRARDRLAQQIRTEAEEARR